MADSARERATRTLRRLQDDFREGARSYQRPGLYHVLVKSSYEYFVTTSGLDGLPKLLQLPPVFPKYGAKSKLLSANLPAPYHCFRHYYSGQLEGLGKFVELASAAASCVMDLTARPGGSWPDPAEAEARMECITRT